MSLYNYVSFVLIEDFNISQTIVSWIFDLLVGVLSSMFSGQLVYKFGKVVMLYAGIIIAVCGLLVVLIPSVMIVIGLVLFTFGFFIAHSLTSGRLAILRTAIKRRHHHCICFFTIQARVLEEQLPEYFGCRAAGSEYL